MEQELENVEETKFKSADDPNVIKVDMNKPVETQEDVKPEETEETSTSEADDSGVVGSDESAEPAQEQEEVQQEAETQEQPIVEEITSEEVEEKVEELAEEVEEAVAEAEATGKPLPENIQKLVDFMEETGGDLEDFVKLNQDYSKLDNISLLREYYKQTKPHLNFEEINFLMQERFSYDEEVDEDKDIRRKKIALKEQVAEAKAYLDGRKSKYYNEIKAGSRLTPEQQKAWDFFNRYNKESEETKLKFEKEKSAFLKKTDNVFNNKFKGFEYNVGDKRFRFNIKDAGKVKEAQTDINNFVKKFLNKDGLMEDAAGYHKSLYTAMNADAIAKHFYEQGKADALKESVNKAKNINMNPRENHKQFEAGGVKVRVLGNDSSDFKFKIKNKK
jgi:hypothetical protein|tara:strand:- start:4 stop:1170 length:1167 start_codon:yes stop_codon:yes gene_type:complete